MMLPARPSAAAKSNSKHEAEVCRDTLDRIVEFNADGIIVVGLDQQILYTNEAAAELFGRPRHELIGSPFGLPLVPAATTEINVVRPGGSETVAEMRAVEMSWLGEKAFVVSLRDIMPRKMLERELRQAHKMEALGNLAGGIAHEFNNLLTAVLFNSGCLGELLPEDSAAFRHAAGIRAVANRAAALTAQLLTFSRKRQVKPAMHDLNSVVANMTTMLSQIIGRHIQLETVLSDEPAPVFIDRNQLEQVIVNLAVNARDAMPSGGTLEYRVEVTDVTDGAGGEPNRCVALAVRDTGCGMSADVQARAFEPFFTTKDDGRGTGLGLATVHGIVHQAGGRILLHSEVGQGTTFRLVLPYRAQIATGLGAQDVEAPGPIRVLLVDDCEDVREVMAELLEERGYHVVCAHDGNEAVQLMHRAEDPFDLVITDMVMPGSSGRQVADEAREITAGVPVLFVSGHSREELPERLRNDPCCEFLAKPFSISEFTWTVARLLDTAASRNNTARQASA